MNRTIRIIYGYIDSMKTGLFLLGLIGIMSAIGSVVSPDSFYNTALFKLLLVLLLLNLTCCTSRQIIGKAGRGKKILSLSKTGTLLIHFGIILVLVGGTINVYYGKNAEVTIAEGETVDIASIMPTSEPLRLHLEQFSIDYNADGSPSQYTALLNREEPTNEASSYTISVNHPQKMAGIKAYQEGFGYLIGIHGNFGANTLIDDFIEPGSAFYLPESDRQVRINEYVPNFEPDNTRSGSLRPDNPKVIFSIYEKGKLLGRGAAPFEQQLEIADGKYITFTGVKPFTILRLKSDPGMPVAASGGFMLILGVCTALIYKPLRKIPQRSGKEKKSSEAALRLS